MIMLNKKGENENVLIHKCKICSKPISINLVYCAYCFNHLKKKVEK